MKKYFIIFCLFFVLAGNCFALQDGLYRGEVIPERSDSVSECIENYPKYVRITNLRDSNVLYQHVFYLDGRWIILEQKECAVSRRSIVCTPITQIIDLNDYGIDAIITNNAYHEWGAAGGNLFVVDHSLKNIGCSGEECSYAIRMMFEPECSFPVEVNPVKVKFIKVRD